MNWFKTTRIESFVESFLYKLRLAYVIMVLWWFTHIHSAPFHERDHLCGRMITGILEPLLHLEASLSKSISQGSFVVTKHCSFSRSSPVISCTFTCTVFHRFEMTFQSATCEQESSLFILPTNVHQLWQKHFCCSNELKCCVQSKFLLCYYCVNDSRSAAQRNPQTKVACTLRLDGWLIPVLTECTVELFLKFIG